MAGAVALVATVLLFAAVSREMTEPDKIGLTGAREPDNFQWLLNIFPSGSGSNGPKPCDSGSSLLAMFGKIFSPANYCFLTINL